MNCLNAVYSHDWVAGFSILNLFPVLLYTNANKLIAITKMVPATERPVNLKVSPSTNRKILPEMPNISLPINLESATRSYFAFSSGGIVLYPAIRNVAFTFVNSIANTRNNAAVAIITSTCYATPFILNIRSLITLTLQPSIRKRNEQSRARVSDRSSN